MLTAIREKTQGIIAFFIVGLIAIPFALWGVNSYFEGGGGNVVAEAGDVEISQSEYRNALDSLRGQANAAMLDSPEFKRGIVERLLLEQLLASALFDEGFRLSDQRLRKLIREIPALQRGGSFDASFYDVFLRQIGSTPLAFEQRLRQDYVTDQLRLGLAQGAFFTDAELSAVLALQLQERRFAHVEVSPQDFAKGVQVSDQQVEERYASRREDFKTEEQARIEYLKLSAADFAKDIAVSDAELRSLYGDGSQYSSPAKRSVSHILIKLASDADAKAEQAARGRIQEIEAKLKKGADFATLAKQHSEDKLSAAKGGDLGELQPGLLPPALEQAVNALKAGQVTRPVRTSFGWHVAKLTKFTPAKQRSFAEAREELAAAARKRKSEERFYEQAEQLRNIAFEQAGSLEPAAKALGLRIEKSDWFTRAGGAGIAADARIVRAAFTPDVLELKHNSDPIELDPTTLAVVRVSEHRPPAIKPLADVRERIASDLRREQAAAKAADAAEAILKAVQSGVSLEEAARRHDASYRAAKAITRQKTEGVDPALTRAVFAAERPQPDRPVYGKMALGAGGQAVYALLSVQDGDPAKADAAVKERVKQQLLSRQGREYFENYRARLRAENDVKIYPDRF